MYDLLRLSPFASRPDKISVDWSRGGKWEALCGPESHQQRLCNKFRFTDLEFVIIYASNLDNDRYLPTFNVTIKQEGAKRPDPQPEETDSLPEEYRMHVNIAFGIVFCSLMLGSFILFVRKFMKRLSSWRHSRRAVNTDNQG